MIRLPEVYNRRSKSIEFENTYKIDGLTFIYGTKFGKALIGSIINKRKISTLYGQLVKSKKSASKISRFVEHYSINTDEIDRPLDSFTSFNDFFIRKLKDGLRPVDYNPLHLISPADSRLIVFDLSNSMDLPVKGYWYSLKELVKDKKLVKDYSDGLCFIYRLAPSDYHRYCYIDDGSQEKVKRLRGVLNSVHPVALSATRSLIARNYRELTILHTDNFGDVLQLEVGALLVGKIIQHHKQEYNFKRGEEKGYFEFGGSTIVQLFKKGIVIPDGDIMENSSKKIEVLVRMGEKVGTSS
ncbi:MAG TPA: phosphatidylserine decarboxylase [Bacteroidales bacterium]|nr:phosphatidylserine decarboxylase [Bacteroidales bacterium]